ncbi:hypothetical protein DMA11_12625 [Marinilabiliaceae bacterium JC017]|nr:hypothetical protein DMA11_12625 [Marinilabiliaceae bacterium JC017]
MTVTFRIISAEQDDFLREVAIDGHRSFLYFHNYLQQLLGYDASNMASFILSDQEWNRQKEISLIEMPDNEAGDISIMDDASICDYITAAKQRLMYVFDFFSERAFFIEVSAITKEKLENPVCLRSEGQPPAQIEIGDILNSTPKEFDEEDTEDEFQKLLDMDAPLENNPDLEGLY